MREDFRPMGYLWTLHAKEEHERWTPHKENPFGEPGVDYPLEYKVTCEPLYSAGEVDEFLESERLEAREMMARMEE